MDGLADILKISHLKPNQLLPLIESVWDGLGCSLRSDRNDWLYMLRIMDIPWVWAPLSLPATTTTRIITFSVADPYMVFPKIMVLQNGWFISWKTLWTNGWFGGKQPKPSLPTVPVREGRSHTQDIPPLTNQNGMSQKSWKTNCRGTVWVLSDNEPLFSLVIVHTHRKW